MNKSVDGSSLSPEPGTARHQREKQQELSLAIPVVRVLLLDFSPAQIAALWHAASNVLPAIEVRMYCRTSGDLEKGTSLAEHYDVVLVDAADRDRWSLPLTSGAIKSLLKSTIVIAGVEPMAALQTALLRAGYPDVVCVQDVHARIIVNESIKAFLRQLRAKRIELPPTVAAPIQRALS